MLVISAAAPARSQSEGTLVYASVRSTGGAADLFVVRADGRALRRLTRTQFWEDQPDWSPDRRRVVFSRGRPFCHGGGCQGASDAEIWVIGADGRGQRRLTIPPDETIVDTSPRWSPDGRSIAFVRSTFAATPGSPDDGIFVIAGDGGEERRIAAKAALAVDWSPDGTRLAYVVVRLGIVDVQTRRARPIPVSNLPVEVADIAWSPDGRRLALAAAGGVYVLPAVGGTARRVVRAHRAESVAWSPGGGQLAFSARRNTRPGAQPGARTDLFVIGSDGGALRRITGNPYEDLAPDWRP
jgi:Tol biopolymer transport system component